MSLAARAISALRNALPAWPFALAGTIAWAGAMAASASLTLWFEGWEGAGRLGPIAFLYALGGMAAFIPAVALARIAGRGRAESTFAAAILALGAGTVGLTALINGIWYRDYYAAWHSPIGTKIWVYQFVFTIGAGVYQFAVLGVRLFLPIGLPALLLAAWLIARHATANGLTQKARLG